MSGRSYEQVCPIAYALDVVGDRWTLLIARELQFGPRRYADLQRTLPGIATNLLVARLRHLMNSGLVRKRSLPAPSPADVYELTEAGSDLTPVLDALTLFGLRYLDSPPPQGAYFGVTPVMTAMRMAFKPEQAGQIKASGQIWAAGEVFHVQVNETGFEIGYGAGTNPAFEIESDPMTLLRMVGGSISPGEAIAAGKVSIRDGRQVHVEALFGAFQ